MKEKSFYFRLKVAFFLIWISVGILFLYFYFKLGLPLSFYVDFARDFFSGMGLFGPVLLILVYTLRPFVLFLPASWITFFIGVLYGPYWGFVIAGIGANLSSYVAFFLGRYFARGVFKSFYRNLRFKNFDAKLKKNGFMTVLLMRLMYFPYDLTSYFCGASAIKFRDFALGTFLGILPGLTTIVFLGGGFLNPYNFLFAGFMFVIGILISRYLSRRNKDLEDMRKKF